MNRLALATLMLAVTTSAAASPNAAQRIENTQARVVAFLPTVRSFDVSEALRKTALRGRQVLIITTPDSARDPRSYLLRLAHVPGITTYIVKTTGTPFVVIDSAFALAGAGLSVQGGPVREAASSSLNAWITQVTAGPSTPPLDLLKLRYQSRP